MTNQHDDADDFLDTVHGTLQQFGVSESDIRATATTLSNTGAESTREALANYLTKSDTIDFKSLPEEITPTENLRTLLAHSARGVSISKTVSADTHIDALNTALETIGITLLVQTDDGDICDSPTVSTDNSSIETYLNATIDDAYTTRVAFQYPDSELGSQNLPTLIATVNTEILSQTRYQFILLSETDRWEAYLIEPPRLNRLLTMYGDTLSIFNNQLLPEHTLSDYVTTPLPEQPTTDEPENTVSNIETDTVRDTESDLDTESTEPTTDSGEMDTTTDERDSESVGDQSSGNDTDDSVSDPAVGVVADAPIESESGIGTESGTETEQEPHQDPVEDTGSDIDLGSVLMPSDGATPEPVIVESEPSPPPESDDGVAVLDTDALDGAESFEEESSDSDERPDGVAEVEALLSESELLNFGGAEDMDTSDDDLGEDYGEANDDIWSTEPENPILDMESRIDSPKDQRTSGSELNTEPSNGTSDESSNTGSGSEERTNDTVDESSSDDMSSVSGSDSDGGSDAELGAASDDGVVGRVVSLIHRLFR